jgi:uncharacterized protein (TIGR02646 family)
VIRLAEYILPEPVSTELAELQDIIDRQTVYRERVLEAARLFKLKNVKRNKTFDAVKDGLDRLCSGARRCGYCEDSFADEVEHIWPRSLYPDKTFVWSNYLYACGPCNVLKGGRFEIYRQSSDRRAKLLPHRQYPPPPGSPLLIDPRHEDPLDYMTLDLIDTFAFVPTGQRPTRSWQRAIYTIRALQLNDRDALTRSRRSAYDAYLRYVGDFIRRRDAGEAPAGLTALIAGLQSQPHPTVWKEMQRQQQSIPELHDLFKQAPEAFGW